ncbi:MAG: cell wall hydrolase [Lachnospiraceae bacterium]|nr:cell wall hydrolase [Lachnospiraceae bacterium]
MREAVRRKLRSVLAIVLMLVSIPTGIAYATSTQEKLNQAQEDKKQTQSQLNETKENLENLKDEKNSLEGKLADLNEKLTEVSNNLNDLEQQIEDKQVEIEKTKEELAQAKETEQEQYESMKTRIRFMYERSDYALIETLLGSGSLAEALNKADYVEQIAAYDRQKLDEYEAIRVLIEEEEAKLKKEKEELDELHAQVKAEKKKVNSYVNQTSSEISMTSSQISDAEAQALAYEAQIKEQEANIEYLKKKLAEEQALSKLAAQSSWRDISEVQFEEGDRYLLANLIYCEAGGEPYAGQLAVGAVVINRVLSSVYPNTMVGVIYQKYQFSPVGSGRLAIAMAENRATASCYKAADEAMAGQTNVGNCVYFRTPIPGLTGIQIGGHIFY